MQLSHLDELELKKENVSSTKASFLDIDLKMKEKKISTKLFDTRDSFSLEIVSMLFFSSNIPSKILFFFGSEILLLVRNTSDHLTVTIILNKLLNKKSKQGISNRGIKILLNKACDCHLRFPVKFQQQLRASLYCEYYRL